MERSTAIDAAAGAKIWNDALGWNVIGVDSPATGWTRVIETVPTYGVALTRTDMFGKFTNNDAAGQWTADKAGCHRDAIHIAADLSGQTLTIAMAHEMGHALFRQGDPDHSKSASSVMYPNNLGTNTSVGQYPYRGRLNAIRDEILIDGVSNPCALRGLCP